MNQLITTEAVIAHSLCSRRAFFVSVYFPEAVDGWQVGLGAGWV